MDHSKMVPKAAMMGNGRDMMWHGAPNAAQTHGAVSVVTTVYPGMPSFAGPTLSYNTATTHPNGANMFGLVGGQAPVPSFSYVGNQPASISKRSSSGYDPNGGLYGAHDVQHPRAYSGHGPTNDFAPNAPRHALAAAQAAAAAVATATATATAVAIDQSQFQNYSQPVQYGSQYEPQMSTGLPAQHQSDLYASSMMPQQRPAMQSYGPVQGGVRLSRAMHPNVMPKYPSGPASRSPASMAPIEAYGQHQFSVSRSPATGMANMAALPQKSVMQLHPGNAYGPPLMNNAPNVYHQQQRFPANDSGNHHYHGAMSASNSGAVNAGYGQATGPAPMQNNYGQLASGAMPNHQNRVNNVVYAPPVTALPNNPTPPLTPAATGGMPPPAGFGGGAAAASQSDDVEPRLTLPVKNGVILDPFRLEHNSPVSQHMFNLDERTHQLLVSNSTFDLQLKCFHAEDKSMANNWPHNANIQICVNGSPVTVKSVERPLYIKSLCQKLQNTLQVAVQQCCCSHLFCLSVVTRPTIESVIRELTRVRSIPQEQCVEKIRSFFNSGDATQLQESGASGNSDIEQTSVSTSLKCPITMKRIKLPARGKECKHPQCFDLYAYLEINKDRSNWQCPICKRPAPMEALEIDQYVLLILTKLNNFDVDEVTMDATAAWKPVMKTPAMSDTGGPSIKDEAVDVPCSSAKRFKSEPVYSSSSWNQATLSTPPSTSQLQAHMLNRLENVLSPYYQPNNSPNCPASFPLSAAGAAFGSPPTQRAPAPGRSDSMPVTPHHVRNPSSVSTPSGGHNGQLQMQQGALGFGSGNSLQKMQSMFSGPTTSSLMLDKNSGGNYHSNRTSTSNTGVADFPDFTFDDSDLLGSSDMAQAGGSIFNDEDLLKYLADPIDFGAASDQHCDTARNAAGSSSGNSSANNYRNSSYLPSDMASMEDILALLRKS